MLLVGTRINWVERREELDRAINDRTAMLFFYNEMEPEGQIKRDEWIRVGKQRGIPTFNDAASDTPPVERLSRRTSASWVRRTMIRSVSSRPRVGSDSQIPRRR